MRGVTASGALSSCPTFLFVTILGLTIVVGMVRLATGNVSALPVELQHTSQMLTLFILLRAFASGCTAMTGVEAIANGVQAFKKPESQNARTTLSWMAGILLFMFVGTSVLASLSHAVPSASGETVLSQIAR